MKKKIFNFGILFTIFVSLSQSVLVYIFNHYLIIDYSAYKMPPQSFEMLNLNDQKLYHLRQNLSFLNSVLSFLLIILFSFIHLFLFFIFRKEKFMFLLTFSFIYVILVFCFSEYFSLKTTILWQFFIYSAFIFSFIYIFLLDKFFQSHIFKIYFIFVILYSVFLKLDLEINDLYFQIAKFFKFFSLIIYLFILLILMRKKEF